MNQERPETFSSELEHLLNKWSIENETDTPDFILAKYLTDCLAAFRYAANERRRWYVEGNDPK